MEVELNGRQIDLSKALPLKIRDWNQLDRQGVTVERLERPSMPTIAAVLYYVLHKADSSVTQDEIDNLDPLADPTVKAVFDAVNTREPMNGPL